VRTRPTRDGDATVVTYDITDARRARQTLLTLNDELSRLAALDGLTGLANRRSFDATLAAELARTERDGTPISLLIADVDRFKRYNDTYGHPAGDECLRLVAQCLRQSARRAGDTVARYGGEEFAAILAGTDEDAAYRAAEKFRVALRELAIPHGGAEAGIVTVSIGISGYAAGDRRRYAAELIARADEALYDAKAAGRDRVTGWRPRHEVREA
jgi:diguanylate cyclase (GGDEF)-like protein